MPEPKVRVKGKPKSEFVLAPVSIASLATAISQRTKSGQLLSQNRRLLETSTQLLNEMRGVRKEIGKMRKEMGGAFKKLGERIDSVARELHEDHLKIMK
jgi:hypothetical protein